MEKVREIKEIKLPHTTTVIDNDWSFIKEQLEIIRNKVQFFSHEDGNRSEERRVGKECLHQCISRWSPYH